MEDKEIALSSSYCWCCRIDENNRGELLRLCKCADKVIHVYCLKKRANTVNIPYCLFCDARYPLERRPKSLLKMLLKVCDYFFLILLMILINYTIGLIIYSVLLEVLDLLNVQFPFIVKIIDQGIFLWFIYMTVPTIVDWSKRMYKHYHQWYKSTYEWKLIRPSTVKNIEEYNIEET